MRTVPVSAVGLVEQHVVERARACLATLATLGDVLAWARGASPPRQVAEIVSPDEYTHDVVLPFDGALWLVFDTT